MTSEPMRARPPGAADFDLLIGRWSVAHRRLKRRLAGDTDWIEFGGTMHADLILSGLGNFDYNVIDLPGGGYQACTLRLFRPETGQWSIHWIDGRDPKLEPPMIGAFQGGVGTFHGNDSFEGRPIHVRFLWSDMTPAGARWEQAFSVDDGVSWETNWIMRFARA